MTYPGNAIEITAPPLQNAGLLSTSKSVHNTLGFQGQTGAEDGWAVDYAKHGAASRLIAERPADEPCTGERWAYLRNAVDIDDVQMVVQHLVGECLACTSTVIERHGLQGGKRTVAPDIDLGLISTRRAIDIADTLGQGSGISRCRSDTLTGQNGLRSGRC